MEKAFNDQIKWEYFSAYLYLSLSAYFTSLGLPGFANWMDVQFQEEQFHARIASELRSRSAAKARQAWMSSAVR